MQINKEAVDDLIAEFEIQKDSIRIMSENLSKFDRNKPEDKVYLSFIEGQGGYYIKFLNFIISKLHPANIVELGNREGLSTLSIYDAMQDYDSKFYTIDIEKDQRYCPEPMFNDKNVSFLFGDVCSYDIIKKLPKKIDLLFTDTIHYGFQLRDEFEIYEHLLSDTALVAIDDININDKRGLFDEVDYSKWDLTELCHESGWGLFLYKRKNTVSEETQTENLYRSIMKVWERKCNYAYRKMLIPTYYGKFKMMLKKISPIYNAYTKSYNTMHYMLKKRGLIK